MSVEIKEGTVSALSAETVEALSVAKQEPTWMLQKRLAAWKLSQELTMPTGTEEEWRRTDLRGLDVSVYQPLPPVVQAVQRAEALPPVLGTYLRLPETPVGGAVVHQDGSVVWQTLSDTVQQQGVLFCALDSAVQQYPELVQSYFMAAAVPAVPARRRAVHPARGRRCARRVASVFDRPERPAF